MEDLGHLAADMNYGSMAGGNTVSTPPAFAAEGSASEGTAGYPVRNPGLEAGAPDDYARFQHSGHDDAFAGHGWQQTYGH